MAEHDKLPARWYCVSHKGMATLCLSEYDARETATESDALFPQSAPHIAVELAPAAALPQEPAQADVHHKLDNDRQVFFYEQDFYVLSNFSAFRVTFDGQTFDTSEAAYHYQRFTSAEDRRGVMYANSAHEAFRYAQDHKASQRPDWDTVKGASCSTSCAPRLSNTSTCAASC
jgi:hypothetical protein